MVQLRVATAPLWPRLRATVAQTPRACPLLARQSSSLASSDKQFYATTPIFYVNAAPHIGHLHSQLLADVYTRYSRWRNPDKGAVMCTGTDEHGLKIQRVAEAQSIPPKKLCDGVSERFKDLARAANVDYQIFIRTTEERHRRAVEHVWRELDKRGYIYKSSYAGWYAVSDETYVPEDAVGEVIDSKSGEKYMASTETGTRVEWMEEENYKFQLSAFREPLLEWLRSAAAPVQPPSRADALLAELTRPGNTFLEDLSISRPASRLTWGISVPDDPGHTIYVWIDALVNYLTAAGYPWQGGEAFEKGKLWPPDLQVVGKDIIRFHALYLPAVLLALDLPLPKTLLTHGHWTMDSMKMSKSRGNVADPFEAMQFWGVDTIRMYLMWWGGNSGKDADYSTATIERFYKKDLEAQVGNLASRITTPKVLKKLESPELLWTMPSTIEEDDKKLLGLLQALPATYAHHLATFRVDEAIQSVFDAVREANWHISHVQPWLKTTSPSAVHRALFFESETLRIAGILLQPIMPEKTKVLLDVLGVDLARRRFEDCEVGKGGERTPPAERVQVFPAVVAPGSTTEEKGK